MFTAVSVVTILLVASQAAAQAQNCTLNPPVAVTNCLSGLAVSWNKSLKNFGGGGGGWEYGTVG